MKAKALVAGLLVAAALRADARFAWQYPRKTVSPDESGHWIVISGNARSHAKGDPQLKGFRTFSEIPTSECLR